MTHPVGGIRSRLIRDSIYHCLYDSLEALGWFDVGRRHKPVTFTGRVAAHDEEIQINSIALADEDLFESDLEMGSTAVETRWIYYLDFFAEDDSIGKALAGDVRDILGGRMSSIGRDAASIPVYDYRLATPTVLFRVDVERIVQDRAHNFPNPWQKHWYSVRFEVADYYSDEGTEVDQVVQILTIGTSGGLGL